MILKRTYLYGASMLWGMATMAPPDAPGGGQPPKREPMGSPSLKMPVETQLGNEFGGTVEAGNYTGDSESHIDDAGLTADISHDGASVRKDDDHTETKVDRPEGEAVGDLPALPDFNPEDPATVQAYDTAFTAEGGKGYNFAALSADFYKNNGEGLSEGTYKWLESRGVDRATAKAIEEGQKALAGSGAQAIFARAGGEANYRGAIEWAKGGGYTAEQRKAFNAALDAGGETASMAVDALMARAQKGGFRSQRRQQPERTTAAAGGGSAPAAPAVQPFASYADYQAALREAKRNNNQEAFDTVRKRGKASGFY